MTRCLIGRVGRVGGVGGHLLSFGKSIYLSRSRRCGLHPGRGARFLARASRRGVSPDEDPGIARRGEIPTTPIGCRTCQPGNQCDTLTGSYTLYASRFPGSSALRASTPGLKSGDPSGASPLRDRQAVAAGRGSVNVITQRQGASPLPLSSNASPVVDRGPARTIIFRTFPT